MLNIVLAYLILFVFPNYMFTSLLLLFFYIYIFYERAMSSPEKYHLKITIIIIIIIKEWWQGLKRNACFLGCWHCIGGWCDDSWDGGACSKEAGKAADKSVNRS